MQVLMALIVTWLSANFSLPESYDHPQIVFMTPDTMQVARSKAAGGPANTRTSMAAAASPQVAAFYDDATKTIYLPRDWAGNTPAELSLLVHEMVHHLQSVAGLKYACRQEREKVAYMAQDKWLEQFGMNLVDAFELNAMTVLVRTNCFY